MLYIENIYIEQYPYICVCMYLYVNDMSMHIYSHINYFLSEFVCVIALESYSTCCPRSNYCESKYL